MYVNNNTSLCKLINRINLQMLVSGKASVDPGWHGNVMSPIFSRLYYICKGAFSIRGKESCKLEEGNWYLIPTGYSFDYECENEMVWPATKSFKCSWCSFKETCQTYNAEV